MERRLFSFIMRHSKRDQLLTAPLVLATMVVYFLSLDLPKTIVNGPIQGDGFDSADATARFLAVRIELPDFLRFLDRDGVLDVFAGFEIERIPYLIALSLTFLLLVLINGGFKLQINTMKGRLGERMLRRLRYELFDRVLRFPLLHFRKVKQAEIATMIKDEVEPLGGFIGDAYAQPAFLGGQAITALTFILMQSVYLGIVTVVVLLLQLAVIPQHGYWSSELTLPDQVFRTAGYEVDYATPRGQRPFVYGVSVDTTFRDQAWNAAQVSPGEAALGQRYNDRTTPEGQRINEPRNLHTWLPPTPRPRA